MTIYEVLKKDHEMVADLLGKIERTTERSERKRADLFDRLKTTVLAHAQAEDAVFYSRLREGGDDVREIALEAHEEHEVVSRLLEEMSELAPDDEVWSAKFKVLKEAIEHHVEEEEGEMFKLARKTIDRTEAQELAERMKAQKERLESRGPRRAEAQAQWEDERRSRARREPAALRARGQRAGR